jgi:hypothetical protein
MAERDNITSVGKHAAVAGMKSRAAYGKDKGMAPAFRGQPGIEDGQNINIPKDAFGYEITIQRADANVRPDGNANFVGPFKEIVGPENLLKGPEGRYADGDSGRGRGIGRDSGLNERANQGSADADEADENDDLE